MIEDFLNANPKAQTKFDEWKTRYDIRDNVPKQILFIDYSDGVSRERKQFISDGIKSLLP